MVIFPLIAVSCMGIMFNLPKDLPIGVVNYETSCHLTQNFTKCHKENLSCRLIHEIQSQDSLKVFLYNSTDVAFKDGHKGKLNTIFELPRNFTEILIDRLDLYDNFDDDVTDDSYLSDLAAVHLDNTHLHLTQSLQKNLNRAIERFFKEFLGECGFSKRLAKVTGVVFEDPIYGTEDGTFKDDIFSVFLLA